MKFERVMEVFAEYLCKDEEVEVIQTKQGYSLLVWDGTMRNWSRSEFCETPGTLCRLLCAVYADYLELSVTDGKRDLTDGEQAGIDAKVREMEERCKG